MTTTGERPTFGTNGRMEEEEEEGEEGKSHVSRTREGEEEEVFN